VRTMLVHDQATMWRLVRDHQEKLRAEPLLVEQRRRYRRRPRRGQEG
jgi:hypothetical protein